MLHVTLNSWCDDLKEVKPVAKNNDSFFTTPELSSLRVVLWTGWKKGGKENGGKAHPTDFSIFLICRLFEEEPFCLCSLLPGFSPTLGLTMVGRFSTLWILVKGKTFFKRTRPNKLRKSLCESVSGLQNNMWSLNRFFKIKKIFMHFTLLTLYKYVLL